MVRSLVYAANWKLHHGPAAARDFVARFAELTEPREGRELWFFPTAIAIAAVADGFRRRADVRVGAQNVHWEPKGAFTGELSVPLVAEAGATHVLVGHSERRHIFGETVEQSARKTVAVLAAGLTALVCVGETLAEREAGRTEDAVRRQLDLVLEVVATADRSRLLIAYEPVWAIGTGRNATPADAAQVHRFIRSRVEGRGWTDRLRVLYGGSVNAGNALAILAEPDVDGVLVGGASLNPEGWAEIVGLGG
ncbi:MAG TPA: triose-phosphate isomerase [Gemmatimonadales bacterium]|jgi:triosephosphate isomerase|nr:triose-phosphate isomerase [Gemmatimonadales bacterium]